MSDVGQLIAETEHHGEFYCEVCEETVELDAPDGFDETREQVLEHKRTVHDEDA